MNIPANTTKTVSITPTDANGNSPAIVDGPNAWNIDGTSAPNGSTTSGSKFSLAVASNGDSALLTPTASGGPSVIGVSNTANGAGISGSLSVTIVGFAVALVLTVV